MLGKLGRFFKAYKKLAFVVVAIVAALGLTIAGQNTIANWILAVTSLIILVPLLIDMVDTLRHGHFGVDVLAATAIVTSVLLGEYWAGIIIVLMLTGGEALEDYAESRAKSELSALLKQRPKKAHLVLKSGSKDIPVSLIKINDSLLVKPGEVVPADSVIIEGSTSVDESSLTGESLPVDKKSGDELLSGSINVEGEITVRALRAAADSQYEQIIKLVRSASASQSPFVRMADRYSVPFTIVAYLIAGSVWVISGDPNRFLEVIVVATPCPLLLGAPIALISGMSRAAKNGIIVKTGSALERLAEVKTIAFDKTGTLTKGTPEVDNIKTYGKTSKEEVLVMAATLEQSSTHILARAITDEASHKGLKLAKAKQVKEIAGRGVSGRLGGKTITVGRLSYMHEEGVAVPASAEAKQTATYVAVNDQLIGVITFKDEIRTESKAMLDELQRLGVKHSLMVTGDNEKTAHAIAGELGIEDVRAECLPADKILAIEAVANKPVAFVGDGVNDSPVLTAADVGIALGARGSTAASESADIVIMLDDVSRVGTSFAIAKRTFSIARQAILIGIMLSLGLMLVFATGRFKAVQGAALQEVVDVAVILYALRAHTTPRLKKASK